MNETMQIHGAVSWTELLSPMPEEAMAFYSEVFGWTYQTEDMGDGLIYNSIQAGERQIGGVMQTPSEASEQPPMWTSYVTVNNLDSTLEKVQQLGGTLLNGPNDIPEVGRCAFFKDPQGAMFHAVEYHMEK